MQFLIKLLQCIFNGVVLQWIGSNSQDTFVKNAIKENLEINLKLKELGI